MDEPAKPSVQDETSQPPQSGPVDMSNFYRKAPVANDQGREENSPRASSMMLLRMWSENHKLLVACLACAGIFFVIFLLFFLFGRSPGELSPEEKAFLSHKGIPQSYDTQLFAR